VCQPDTYVFEEDADADVTYRIKREIAIGAPIGAIAGMTIMALAIPGVGILGVGAILAAGGITGAFAGTVLGAVVGLAVEGHELDEACDWERIPLGPDQILVVVADHGHPDRVPAVLQLHGGRPVTKPPHLC